MIILFGGTGFVGQNIVKSIGDTIPCVVVGRNDRWRAGNSSTKVRFVPAKEFEGAVEAEYISQATALIYLASASVVGTYVNEPWREIEADVLPGVKRIYRWHQQNPQLRITFVSSGGTVYGPGHSFPIPEDAPLQPVSPYAIQKVMFESWLTYIGRTAGLDYRIARVSNPVGLWQTRTDQGLIPIVLDRIKTGSAITLYGDGSQVRDYIATSDVADALLLIAQADKPSQVVFNVGSGQGLSVLEVLDLIEQSIGQRPVCEQQRARGIDVEYSVLDCTKLARRLGWRATTSISKCIEDIWSAQQNDPKGKVR